MHWISASIAGFGKVGTTQSNFSHVVDTPCSGPNIDDESSTDWLHNNPTYQRRTIVGGDVCNMSVSGTFMLDQESIEPASYVSGRSLQMIGVFAVNIII